MAHSSLTAEQIEAAAETFALLATPSRLHIVLHLIEGPMDVSSLAEHIEATVAATSQQLAKLKAAGVVASRRRGVHRVYSVEDQHIVEIVGQVFRHINPDGSVKPHKSLEQLRPMVDNFEDLRSDLPGDFADAPNEEVLGLWMGVHFAKHGKTAAQVAELAGISTDDADQIISLLSE